MRASWPFGVAVIVVGGLAGALIAGRPRPTDPFVLEPTTTSAELSTTSQPTSVVPSVGSTPASTPDSTVATTVATTVNATTEVPATAPNAEPVPRDEVRLVIVNGDGRSQLAAITADRIRALGYIVDVGVTSYRVDETVLFYRPGFDREATKAANDIGVPDAVLLEYSTEQPITSSDASGDIIVVLGGDAPG